MLGNNKNISLDILQFLTETKKASELPTKAEFSLIIEILNSCIDFLIDLFLPLSNKNFLSRLQIKINKIIP